jgi:hypothetical protein
MDRTKILRLLYPNGIPPEAYDNLEAELAIAARLIPMLLKSLQEMPPQITIHVKPEDVEVPQHPSEQEMAVLPILSIPPPPAPGPALSLPGIGTFETTAQKREREEKKRTRTVHVETEDEALERLEKHLRRRPSLISELSNYFNRSGATLHSMMAKLRSKGVTINESKGTRSDSIVYSITGPLPSTVSAPSVNSFANPPYQDADSAIAVDSVTVGLLVDLLNTSPRSMTGLMGEFQANGAYVKAAIRRATKMGHNIVETEPDLFTLLPPKG